MKIIEDGRISNPEELSEILGGVGCNKYNNCGWFFHETCAITSQAYGYESESGTIHCDTGYYYASCTRSAYTTCGGAKNYWNR